MKIPIESELLTSVDEAVLRNETARLENCFITKAGTLSRFPRLKKVLDLPGGKKSRVYLKRYKGDLIAVSGGRTYRLSKELKVQDVTNATVSGSGRVIFAVTDNELVMAAGGSLIAFAGDKTEILSKDAPNSTHVGYVDGYLVAIEINSGRFYHSSVSGTTRDWNPIDTFSADGNPDNLNALLVSEYKELLMAGPESIEQFDSAASGKQPFYRRWTLGDGLYAPYTFLSADNRIWGVNQRKEFVAYAGQTGRTESDNIQAPLEAVGNWKDAWGQEIAIAGERFILLQIPEAENVYGTPGITLLYDYRKRRWANLYGWNAEEALPARWDGWSIEQAFDRMFVGGEGCIYELTGFDGSEPQRVLWRSGHIDSGEEMYPLQVNRLIFRVKRGAAAVNAPAPVMSFRVNKDNRGWGRWVRLSLGRAGQREMVSEFPSLGVADTWQFEVMAVDSGPFELAKVEAEVMRMGK